MAKVLVLGGDGFVGSHLIDSLLKRDFEVTCFSLLNGKPPINLNHIKDKIKIIDGDFSNLEDLDKAMEGMDYVFHMISFSTPASSMDDHFLDIKQNVIGTIKLLELCVKHKIKKVIYPSSGGAIYGNQLLEKYSETTVTNPISLYGISKLTIENYLEYFRNVHGLDYLTFRISNPFGERQNPRGAQGLIAVSLFAIKEHNPINIYGDGNNVRDYLYVTDVSDLMANVFDSDTKYRLYNLGSGEGHSINNILEIYRSFITDKFEVNYLPARKSDVVRVVLDVSRIEDEFNFKPKIKFEDGIKLTWDYLNK